MESGWTSSRGGRVGELFQCLQAASRQEQPWGWTTVGLNGEGVGLGLAAGAITMTAWFCRLSSWSHSGCCGDVCDWASEKVNNLQVREGGSNSSDLQEELFQQDSLVRKRSELQIRIVWLEATSHLPKAFDCSVCPFWAPKQFIALQSRKLLQDDIHISSVLKCLGQVNDPTSRLTIIIDPPPLPAVRLVAHSKCFVGADRLHALACPGEIFVCNALSWIEWFSSENRAVKKLIEDWMRQQKGSRADKVEERRRVASTLTEGRTSCGGSHSERLVAACIPVTHLVPTNSPPHLGDTPVGRAPVIVVWFHIMSFYCLDKKHVVTLCAKQNFIKIKLSKFYDPSVWGDYLYQDSLFLFWK